MGGMLVARNAVGLRLVALLSASLGLGGVFGGCAAPPDESEEGGLSDDGVGADECDRSTYNCKLPAAKIDRNRIYNYANDSYDWPIAGGTELLNGLGDARGHVKDPAVKINYGNRKKINGVTQVYAFAAPLDTGIVASGWVKEAALADGPISRMKTVNGKNPGQGDYEATWTVTGGDNAAFAGLKVNPGYNGSDENATDYLLRNGGVVNLLYNLPGSGGVSTDTFPTGVKFKRAKGVLELETKLYKKGGTTVIKVMKFIYGHIGGRYGWIARDALVQDAASVPGGGADPGGSGGGGSDPGSGGSDPGSGSEPPATGQCYARCCDGSLQGPMATVDPAACVGESSNACSGHGYVKRSEWNGAEAYSRPEACYAKCANREKYHEVEGVTSGCHDAAVAYCAVGDRGAFQDAMWSQCPP